MRKAYITLPSGRQVHYRTIGDGPPLILLHQSPQNSEALEPAMKVFSSLCRCIALDTPGYGLSPGFTTPAQTIGDYADGVIEVADAFGLENFFLYGVATGSQIGIEVAKRYPDRVKFLMLDANGHLSAEERKQILDGYFPDVTPRRDGGHLLTWWNMCRQLFVSFPWQSGRIEDRLKLDQPPAELVQTILIRYLQAGQTYHHAYRIAFETEDRDHMNGLSVPTTMVRWEGSAALSMTDALLGLGVPECVSVLNAGPALETRYTMQQQALEDVVARWSESSGDNLAPKEQQAGFKESTTFECGYFSVGDMQVHGRARLSGQGKPLVILHDTGESGLQLQNAGLPDTGNRPILILDLPGHGDSSLLPTGEPLALDTIAGTVSAAIRLAGFEGADLFGRGLGGAIGIAVSHQINLNHIYIVDPAPYSEEEKSAFLAKGIPDISPRPDGTHLITAWTMLRDAELYWPWFDTRHSACRNRNADLCPETLHIKTVDLLKAGPEFSAFKKLETGIDWQTLLAEAKTPITLASSIDHPNPERVAALTQNKGNYTALTSPRGNALTALGLLG